MWGFIMKQIKMLRQTNAYVGIATVRYGGIHAMMHVIWRKQLYFL